MSYYDVQSWQGPARQGSWEQQTPPSRSGTSSVMQREDSSAFWLHFDEVDRAIDNLAKSGKLFSGQSRRESMPTMGAPSPYSEYGPRMGGMPLRHHSVSDFDPTRSPSVSNLQNFYAAQRFQPRHNEAEQMQQAKRRMAAQRERELRNYHQEQQYNRKISTQGKSERSVSPSSANEEDRRGLIARQHRALYGVDGGSYYDGSSFGIDSHTPRANAQAGGASGSAASGRGPSPLSYNSFGLSQEPKPNETAPQYNGNEQNNNKGRSPKPQQSRSRANSNSSPASASNPQSFSLFENAQQSSRTSTSSPGGSPPRPTKASTGPIGSGVAPIGTRPAQGQTVIPALNKRSTTPLPSPLSYGFAPTETAAASSNANERSTSAASNPPAGAKEPNMGNINWGSSSGVWGKTPLGVWG